MSLCYDLKEEKLKKSTNETTKMYFNVVVIVWCLSSDENKERSSSAPFVGKTGRRSFPTEAGDLQGRSRALMHRSGHVSCVRSKRVSS